jgi:hypothetical protein
MFATGIAMRDAEPSTYAVSLRSATIRPISEPPSRILIRWTCVESAILGDAPDCWAAATLAAPVRTNIEQTK